MSDNETNSKNTFANFMNSKKNDDSAKSNYVISTESKTKESLNKAREDKENEKKKALDEAKKNSMALANRYGKADMMKMQARNLIMMAPFIIVGVVVFMLLIFKGGTWLSKGLNALFNTMVGN